MQYTLQADDSSRTATPVCKARAMLALKTFLVIVVFFIGFLIGYFAMRDSRSTTTTKPSKAPSGQDYAKKLADSLKAESIEGFLRTFTKRPHMGGTEQNDILAKYTKETWESFNFDKVDMPRYDVLLSMPPKDKSNSVQILNTTNNDVIVNIQGKEKTAEPSENDPLVAPPFLAYSPAGNVTGDLIYVNYGTVEDFKDLGYNCSNKIVIMRYGRIFRGNMVQNAERCGALGVILYSDPADIAPAGVNNTFPKSWWLPGSGAQRGTVYDGNGDPLTPYLPATNETFRIPFDKVVGIPKIPAQPMGYDDARKLLSRMNGPEVPMAWRGGLDITYRLGPGFSSPSLKVRLEVNNELNIRPTYNVIGSIVGREEPDRVVLLGNHRDAWVFGGVDPSSGTAVMMEVSRGLGELLKTGWRPRRTIMLCSWGAEEYGLIGSWEWGEDNQKWLGDRAVTYINLDSAVSGNYSFYSSGNPLLFDLIMGETKEVDDKNQGEPVFDVWKKRFPSKDDSNKPSFRGLGSGSDYTYFAHFIGIPSTDLRYTFRSMNRSGYPVYHSVHDTFYWQKTFNDPYFKTHLTVAQVASRVLIAASDSPMIPYSLFPYSKALVSSFQSLQKNNAALFKTKNITLDFLLQAVNDFKLSVDNFESKKKKLDTKDFAKLRTLNDQMMFVERAFIWPYGLPGRPDVRQVLFAPELHNAYGAATFPGISDVLFDIEKTGNWLEVKRQISIITYSIRAAVKVLEWIYD